MFLIRQSKPADSPTLLKLARMVYFINLPPIEEIILGKIAHSARCFAKAAGVKPATAPTKRRKGGGDGLAASETDSDMFMFTIEDLETGGVIGTSQIRSHMGGPGAPNWSMQLIDKSFRSDPLGFGTSHKVMQLYGDETGPAEIGGLILQPSHRGHRLRPGRFLSFVRFHYVALHRKLFADRIIAEMMGPVTNEGDSPFWDAFGRKFIPVRYAEADRFCQHNRKFISELLPKEEIYLTLFPLEIQNIVGVVSRETIPARRLLESLGFEFRGFIDPFDGGPHLDAPTDQIPLVRSTRAASLGDPISAEKCDKYAIVSTLSKDGDFRAVDCPVLVEGKSIRVAREYHELLSQDESALVGYTLVAGPDPEVPVEMKPEAQPKPKSKARRGGKVKA